MARVCSTRFTPGYGSCQSFAIDRAGRHTGTTLWARTRLLRTLARRDPAALPDHADFTHTRRMFTSRHAPYAITPEVAALLARHYNEPHRAYHNAQHITEVLRWFDAVADEVGWSSPRDVYDAVLFHDVIYDPKAHDNEERSAELAVAHGCSSRTAELIQLTARHGKVTRDEVATDAALFLDCDTAILGAPMAEFDAYNRAIAIEYGHVPAEAFRAGRGAFLRMMRERPRLFLTEYFHAKLDEAARANLDHALRSYS